MISILFLKIEALIRKNVRIIIVQNCTCSVHNNVVQSTCYCSINVFSFSIELLNFRDLIVIDLLNAEAKKYDGNKSLFLIRNESI